MKKIFISIIAVLACFILFQTEFSSAQCALCKATAETSLKEGNNSAAGLNVGILYLLVVPYALIGGLGYWWYTTSKKRKQLNQEA
ncbi:MAG TPA: hypothetical protein DCQ93_01245 [Bacteroidetes bacterium]|nr:hypothetical protein [Bacteroidota bacterium]